VEWIFKITQAGIGPPRRPIQQSGASTFQGLVWALLVAVLDEAIEPGLLLQQIF
jgi:hypothetical protein